MAARRAQLYSDHEYDEESDLIPIQHYTAYEPGRGFFYEQHFYLINT